MNGKKCMILFSYRSGKSNNGFKPLNEEEGDGEVNQVDSINHINV